MIDNICWLIHAGVSAVLDAGTGRPYISRADHYPGQTMLRVRGHSEHDYIIVTIDTGRIAIVTSLRAEQRDDAYKWLPLHSDLDFGTLVPS